MMMNLSIPLKRPDALAEAGEWVDVCAFSDLVRGSGLGALVRDQQVAVILSRDGKRVYAISNFDPFSKAFVLSRGIIGDAGGTPKIASPIYKQCFNLLTGECLDDPSVRVATYPVRVEQGRIELQVSKARP
jgi:nitrite reductase (NADH) small subunit